MAFGYARRATNTPTNWPSGWTFPTVAAPGPDGTWPPGWPLNTDHTACTTTQALVDTASTTYSSGNPGSDGGFTGATCTATAGTIVRVACGSCSSGFSLAVVLASPAPSLNAGNECEVTVTHLACT